MLQVIPRIKERIFKWKSEYRALNAAVYSADSHLENERDLRAHADFSYDLCCQWFGMPEDHEVDFRLLNFHYSACTLDPQYRIYYIYIRNDGDVDSTCQSVGHEIYHRVTVKCKGLCQQQPWADEMLASIVSIRLLRCAGRNQYADNYEALSSTRCPLDVRQIMGIRKSLWYRLLAIGPEKYPPEFGPQILCLGKAFVEICGWDALAALVKASKLADWIRTLPSGEQTAIKVLLGQTSLQKFAETVTNDADQTTIVNLGIGLYWIGDYDGAHRLLNTVYSDSNYDVNTVLFLSRAQWRSSHREEALTTLHLGIDKFPESANLKVQAAYMHWKCGNTSVASLLYKTASATDNPGTTEDFLWLCCSFDAENDTYLSMLLELQSSSSQSVL